ncbi:MAG TPA: polyribonucleotide nucleotidyltransferase [Pirellulaceae bacterium]
MGVSSKIRVERQIGRSVLSLETGFLAKQAAGAVIVQLGDTVVLNAAASGASRPGTDFFPLTCDYRERTSAAGKFPGGFIKREGRPSTKETLTSRLIDRPIRPLFPDGFIDEVQCQAVVLSSDRQNDADVLAMNGCAAALHISDLPFEGPVASIRLGRVDGQWVPFPTVDELEESDLDLIISGNRESVCMIEGFAREMPEATMLEAIRAAHGYLREICDLHEELRARVGTVKRAFAAPAPSEIKLRLRRDFLDRLKAVKRTEGKQARAEAVAAVKDQARQHYGISDTEPGATSTTDFNTYWHDLEHQAMRELILSGTRADGRDGYSLRPIECHVGVLPRVHGSAIFQRGETQALISITLGTGKDEQRVDGLGEEYSKKFMLDYNFPSFSVGECRPIRGPGRREIGHGALAERSVKPVLPEADVFPYTVRVVSDILESNGSSSMASVCGATLALMDAGVPINNPVAGISIGLIYEGPQEWVLLTDIIGDEDHHGDMDFKIAGTPYGITGIQLDLKIRGISEEIIRDTLEQARTARKEILAKMLSAIPRPRKETSPYAPRLVQIKIEPDKIGALIGPGGKVIRGIQESTGVSIEVEDDGTVTIASANQQWLQAALDEVQRITATVEVGKVYKGRVTSIKDFGAFIEILPGRDGLCHISELSPDYVNSVTDICNLGDEVLVRVIAIDEHNRVKLSRKQALQEVGAEAH